MFVESSSINGILLSPTLGSGNVQKKSENVRGRERGWASENSITQWVSHTEEERESQQTRREAAWEEGKGHQKLRGQERSPGNE